MKKKNLNNLKLKKEIISSLQKKQISGGKRAEITGDHTAGAFTCPTNDYFCGSFFDECEWSQGTFDHTNGC